MSAVREGGPVEATAVVVEDPLVTSTGKFARRSLGIALRDIVLLATNFGVGILVARSLGPAALGIWFIFQLILAYAESIGRLRVDQAAVFFLGRREHDAGAIAFAVSAIAVLSGTALAAMGVLLSAPLAATLLRHEPDVVRLVPLVLAQIPLQFLYLNYVYMLIGIGDIGGYNRVVVLRALTMASATAVLVSLRPELASVVIASLVAVASGLAYGAARFHRTVALKVGWDWRLIKELTAYGGNLYASIALGQLNAQLTNLLCAAYLVPAQLAYFSLASARRDVLSIVPNAVSTLLFPRVAATSDRAEAARFTAAAARTIFALMILLAIAAALVVRPAVLFLYGEDYEPVVVPFLILLPGFVVSAVASPLNQWFLGTGRPDLVLKIAVPGVVVQLVLAAALIPAYGVIGAAVAVLAALVVGAVLSVVMFTSRGRIRTWDVLLPHASDVGALWRIVRPERSASSRR